MKVVLRIAFSFLFALSPAATMPARAQPQGLLTENPLAGLKEQVDRILEDAGVGFSESQNREIALMMDERRRASEELFGNLQDFTEGPTEGQQADQLASAIDWLREEFLSRIGGYLTADQAVVWNGFLEEEGLAGLLARESNPELAEASQTQYVRIHSDAYTAEDDAYRLGRNGGNPSRTEVIQRGGVGAMHGNVEFLLRDDALNARNPFARNKPDSQERQLRIDLSGPVVRRRWTSRVFLFQNESENVDTINATLPDGVFDLGIVRPTTDRSYGSNNTLQLAEPHSLDVDFEYHTSKGENQGIGGFTLPERAYTTTSDGWYVAFRQFSVLSGQDLYETRVAVSSDDARTQPLTGEVQINVLDAFSRGGAQNRSEAVNRDYEFSNMYTRVRDRWTAKTGIEGAYRTRRSLAEDNFGGTFTFSGLEEFVEGQPVNYRVNQGDPLVDIGLWEAAAFIQNEFRLTAQFTLMAGIRYTNQTRLGDNDNFAPRLSFAWGITPSTVIRGGAGLFHHTFGLNVIEAQTRLDGTRQFETIIEDPSYPDPFQSGTLRQTFPSIRTTGPDLESPYEGVAGIQLEKTFLTNLLVGAEYHFRREIRRHRLRDTNAPLSACITGIPPGLSPDEETLYVQSCRPDPLSGVILNLEPTATEQEHIFRLNYRQRFSIFNAQVRYTLNKTLADSFPSNNPSIPADNYHLASDWGRAPFPLHQVNATLNAELPLGLFLTGQITARTGQRYTITTGRDDNRDGRVTDRPPDVARNTELGAGFLSFDVNISKAFFLGSDTGGARQNVNAFANMSNAFNRLNYGTPSGVLTSPNFGRSTSAQNPRVIELGLRYQF